MPGGLPLYNVIVPRLDKTGPVMLAHDVAKSARMAGYNVRFYYLNGHYDRGDIGFDADVRKLNWRDLFLMEGIVHTHSFRPDLIGALLSFSKRRRTITTIPSYFLADVSFDYPKWKAVAAWHLWRFSLRFFRKRVCISRSMVRYYRRKAKELDYELVYNSRLPLPGAEAPVPAEVADWAAKHRGAGRTILIYAGGLRARKNVLRLVEHCASAEGVALLVVGDGPLEERLRQIVADSDAADRIFFGGFVARARDYIGVCDALVLPSFAEGLANVILEAASVGVPSLLSNIAVHRELSAMGIGVTFNHKSFSDFDEKCRVIAENFTSKEARRSVWRLWDERFSGEASFAEYYQLFEAMFAADHPVRTCDSV